MPSPFDALEKTYKTVDEDVEENVYAVILSHREPLTNGDA